MRIPNSGFLYVLPALLPLLTAQNHFPADLIDGLGIRLVVPCLGVSQLQPRIDSQKLGPWPVLADKRPDLTQKFPGQLLLLIPRNLLIPAVKPVSYNPYLAHHLLQTLSGKPAHIPVRGRRKNPPGQQGKQQNQKQHRNKNAHAYAGNHVSPSFPPSRRNPNPHTVLTDALQPASFSFRRSRFTRSSATRVSSS